MFTSNTFPNGSVYAANTPSTAAFVNPIAAQAEGGSANRSPITFPLGLAAPGMLVRVTALRGSGMDRRMTEMGLNVGADIRVVQQQGGGLVVQRGESRFALGAGLAHRVLVTAV